MGDVAVFVNDCMHSSNRQMRLATCLCEKEMCLICLASVALVKIGTLKHKYKHNCCLILAIN